MRRLAVDKEIPVTVDRIATNLFRMPTALLWSASSDRATTLYVKGRPSCEADPESYRFPFKGGHTPWKAFSYKEIIHSEKTRTYPWLLNTQALFKLASRHRHAREDRRPYFSRLVSGGQ